MLLFEIVVGRQVVQAAVRPHGVVWRRQASMITAASRRDLNHSSNRHSSRNLPLKLSSVPFCQGLPGSLSTVAMPL